MGLKGKYLEKLVKSAEMARSILCLGIDPVLEHIPLRGLPEHRIAQYYQTLFCAMDKAQCYPAALKFNEAYFLAADDPYTTHHGSNALAELMRIIRNHPTLSKVPVIMDCKRCDIGKSAERYAEYYFKKLQVDAITVSPYTGEEGTQPFLAYRKGVYVLAHTTNEALIQETAVESGTLSAWVCRWISIANEYYSFLGAVVSGRDADELTQHLACLSPEVPLLIPGIGAQGGNAKEISALIAKTQNPLCHRIAIGSSIAYAWIGKNDPEHYSDHFMDALKVAQETIRGELNGIL